MIFGKYINRYYLRYLHFYLIGALALVSVDFVQLKIPEYVGRIIDDIGDHNLLLSTLQAIAINMLMIAGVMFVGRFFWRICVLGVGVRVEANLRERMFAHSELLSQSFYHQHKVGAQMALYTNDLNSLRMAFAWGMLMLFDALFLGSLAFYKMYKLNLALTLVSIAPLLLLLIAGAIVGKYMREKFQQRQKAFEQLSEFTQESFSGLSVIKAFVKETKELIAFRKINKNNEEKNLNFLRYSIILEIVINVFIFLCITLMIGVGGYIIIYARKQGGFKFTVGNLSEFISYFNSLIWPIMAIAQLINMRSQAKASYRRIKGLFDQPIEIKDENVRDIKELNGHIYFNHLNFHYPDSEELILKDISLEIKPGESVGIIGRTGCGKTALVDVLLRLYNIPENNLLIDGFDIMRLPFKKVRDLFGYVPQDNFLFSDTIHNNIAFSHEHLSEDEVIRFAKLADVHDNISEFTHGYQTVLGERGVTVSGGQKQRISIARAMAKDPKILILDDSVSAVDSKTEKTILENLSSFRENRTIILVAHRISSIQHMDKIVLMDEGRIVASGTHQELFERVPLYQEMVRLQALEEKIEGEGGNGHE